MAKVAEKPIRDVVRAGSLVYFNVGKTPIHFSWVDDKIRVVVVTKVREHIAV